MSITQLAWLVGLSGIGAAVVAETVNRHNVRGNPARRAFWSAVILGTMMAGWAIGVHNGHWLAALICAGSVAVWPMLGNPDKRPEVIEPSVAVVVFASAVVTFGAVVYYDVVPVCGWWHARYVAAEADPGDKDSHWDLCASAFEVGERG